MPVTIEDFQEKILDMEELWQFPFSWAAVDGCHIPIKRPPGGQESCKEYHNFKNFYSIVLLALVDANYHFVWGSCGFLGNSHDSVILQSTSFWKKVKMVTFYHTFVRKSQMCRWEEPIILYNAAFPFCFNP